MNVSNGIDTYRSSDQSGNGRTAEQLAQMIVDQTTGVTLVAGSASFDFLGRSLPTNPLTSESTNLDAIGWFENGTEFENAAGSPLLLPSDNQPPGKNPTAVYTGAIQIDRGVCLCTGFVSDVDSVTQQPVFTGVDPQYGVGMEGPNNGVKVVNVGTEEAPVFVVAFDLEPGEASNGMGRPGDDDYLAVVSSEGELGGGVFDASVLSFDVVTTEPGYLMVDFVFGSDEHPAFTRTEQDFLDGVGIFVDANKDGALSVQENLAKVWSEDELGNRTEERIDIFQLSKCTDDNTAQPVFFDNQVAPGDIDLQESDHGIDFFVGSPPPSNLTINFSDHDVSGDGQLDANDPVYYNVEFGGFSKRLRREVLLIPSNVGGTVQKYRVKIVVQDVGDAKLDAGVFVAEHSLRLFPFKEGDLNRDGHVDAADTDIMFGNWSDSGPAIPTPYWDGDLNQDGYVDASDAGILFSSWGNNVGNRDYASDFNRDNFVNATDSNIQADYAGLTTCASRYEGDVNCDGRVDSTDVGMTQSQPGLLTQDACSQQQAASGGGGTASAQLIGNGNSNGLNPDFDGDGFVTVTDVEYWKVVFGSPSPDRDGDGTFTDRDVLSWRKTLAPGFNLE